jgi:alcohol dehydrogenase
MAVNAKETMGVLFLADRYQLTENDCVEIYKESYR